MLETPPELLREGPNLRSTIALLLFAAQLGLWPTSALAQVDGPHTEISVLGGKVWPDEGLDMESAAMASLRLGYYPNARLGVELVGDFADGNRKTDPDANYDYSFFGARGVVNLSPVELVSPYVFVGGGVTVLGLDTDNDRALAAHLGGGLRAHVRRGVSIRAELRGLFTGFEKFSIQNFHAGIGVSVSFGQDSDQDHDGITDSYDKCPETPTGAEVDWRGCPFDDDVDGVPNGIDVCPDTPFQAQVDSKGCEVAIPTIRKRR
jgi:OOP family OmpA-OmpF porin